MRRSGTAGCAAISSSAGLSSTSRQIGSAQYGSCSSSSCCSSRAPSRVPARRSQGHEPPAGRERHDRRSAASSAVRGRVDDGRAWRAARVMRPNGAGKTTSQPDQRLFQPTSGRIVFDGKDGDAAGAAPPRRPPAWRGPPDHRDLPELSVADNIRVASRSARRLSRLRPWLSRHEKEAVVERIAAILDAVGLPPRRTASSASCRTATSAPRDRHGARLEAAAAAARRADRRDGRPGDLARSPR